MTQKNASLRSAKGSANYRKTYAGESQSKDAIVRLLESNGGWVSRLTLMNVVRPTVAPEYLVRLRKNHRSYQNLRDDDVDIEKAFEYGLAWHTAKCIRELEIAGVIEREWEHENHRIPARLSSWKWRVRRVERVKYEFHDEAAS